MKLRQNWGWKLIQCLKNLTKLSVKLSSWKLNAKQLSAKTISRSWKVLANNLPTCRPSVRVIVPSGRPKKGWSTVFRRTKRTLKISNIRQSRPNVQAIMERLPRLGMVWSKMRSRKSTSFSLNLKRSTRRIRSLNRRSMPTILPMWLAVGPESLFRKWWKVSEQNFWNSTMNFRNVLLVRKKRLRLWPMQFAVAVPGCKTKTALLVHLFFWELQG